MSIKIIKELVGQVVTAENLVIGHRIAPHPKWNYGNDGDGGLGTIAGILLGDTYGLGYDFVTINWDDDSTRNYPLNEVCLVYSDGKVQPTPISLFKEKFGLYDMFTITEDKNEDEFNYDRTGGFGQVIEVGNKTVKIWVVKDGTFTEWVLDNTLIKDLKFKKKNDKEKLVEDILNRAAELMETPANPKESIIKYIQEKFPATEKILYEFYRRNGALEESFEYAAAQLCGIYRVPFENTIKIPTIFGNTKLTKDGNFYYVYDNLLRNFINKNYLKHTLSLTYKKWKDFFDSFENKTVFTEGLEKVILSSNCNEKLKKYFKDGSIKLDENFIDFNRSSKKIQFTPKGKDVKFDDRGNINGGVRQEMSAHKFFGKYFKGIENVSEYDIKCFADEVISTFGEYKMVELEDGKIGEFYNKLTQSDWTVGSCMRQKPIDYFEIYDKYPHAFKMATIMLNGEVVGRCLKVTAKDIDTQEEFVFFDRLYYKNEEVVAWFNSYCDNNNLTRKDKNNVDSYRTFYNKSLGGTFTKTVYIEILPPDVNKDFEHVFKRMPYLDTMRWGLYGTLINNPTRTTIKGLFKDTKERYTFSRDGGDFHGRDRKGYCHVDRAWVDSPCVEITEGDENYIGLTVRKAYATKTKDGYKI